jgi:hypothetical protein
MGKGHPRGEHQAGLTPRTFVTLFPRKQRGPLGVDTVEKVFSPFEPERLIQDRAPARNVDSRTRFA